MVPPGPLPQGGEGLELLRGVETRTGFMKPKRPLPRMTPLCWGQPDSECRIKWAGIAMGSPAVPKAMQNLREGPSGGIHRLNTHCCFSSSQGVLEFRPPGLSLLVAVRSPCAILAGNKLVQTHVQGRWWATGPPGAAWPPEALGLPAPFSE